MFPPQVKDECRGVKNEGFFAWDSRVAEKWNITILVVTRRSHPGAPGGRSKVYMDVSKNRGTPNHPF